MHTCCLLCHREFKDWGASSANGLSGGHGAKLADAVPALSQALLREVPGQKLSDTVPSLSQSLLGEVPLWICQSCRKSVEEEERRTSPRSNVPTSSGKPSQKSGGCYSSNVPLSHSSSCRAQSCSEGYPEQSSVDWDPSSFLSAHKLSGLWNSNSSGSSPGNPLSTSGDLCKTTPKHFKTMCRRPTPPGEISLFLSTLFRTQRIQDIPASNLNYCSRVDNSA
uniref:Protein FAM193B n=1 Tax=Oncorhynchus kisutch TaxID=8019 RepID=A0A8C7J841_ONCKI